MSRASLAQIAKHVALPAIAVVVALLLLPPKAIDWTPYGGDPDHVDDYAVGKCLDKRSKVVACGHRAAAYKLVVKVDSEHDCTGETLPWTEGPVLPWLFPESVYCGEALKGPDAPFAVGKCLDNGDGVVACGDRAAAYKLVAKVDSDHDCPGETTDTWVAPEGAMGGPDRVYCGVALKGPDVPFAVGKCVDKSYEQVVDCGSEQAHFKLVRKAHSDADCADSDSEEDWGGTTIWYCVRPLRRGAGQSAR